MSTDKNEVAESYEETYDQHLQYLAEGLRTAATKVDAIREGRYLSERHPITGGRRKTDGAHATQQVVNDAVRDLHMIHYFAVRADLAWFPQTQEM